MAADDTCSTISNSAATGSFSNLERLLASWRRAERPGKDSEPPASIIRINQPATRPHTECRDRPCDLAGSRRGPLHEASGCADDQPGQKRSTS